MPLFDAIKLLHKWRTNNDKVKIWKSNEKGSTNLVIAGSGEKFWNLADAEQRQGFNALCSSLWVEGVTRGESKVTLSYNRNCSDTVKYTFIAANCGRQPRTHNGERDSIESSFPGLVRCEWSITGEPTDTYNCIAWSVGETNAWYVNVAGAKFHPTDSFPIRACSVQFPIPVVLIMVSYTSANRQ